MYGGLHLQTSIKHRASHFVQSNRVSQPFDPVIYSIRVIKEDLWIREMSQFDPKTGFLELFTDIN